MYVGPGSLGFSSNILPVLVLYEYEYGTRKSQMLQYSYGICIFAADFRTVDVLRARPAACCCCSVRLSVCQGFAVGHKIWPYRRDFVAANLPKQFKFKN